MVILWNCIAKSIIVTANQITNLAIHDWRRLWIIGTHLSLLIALEMSWSFSDQSDK